MDRIEAIKVIKDNWPEGRHQLSEALKTLIPELNESEDEKIRKEIIALFQGKIAFPSTETIKKYTVWLEKQGKKIDAIENFDTEFEKQVSHLVASTINKEYEYTSDFVKWTANVLLNYAKHELEKKELKKIEPFKQKPAWSEKDEKMLKSVISSIRISRSSCEEDDDVRDLFDNEIDWLESLKERVQPKQEWNEEDKNLLNRLIGVLDGTNKEDYHEAWEEKFLPWLKSLKERYTWKPSDEQMKFLWRYAEQNNYDGSILTSLYNDLKKLREE